MATISIPSDISSIQSALNASEDGGDLLISAGDYRGFFRMKIRVGALEILKDTLMVPIPCLS